MIRIEERGAARLPDFRIKQIEELDPDNHEAAGAAREFCLRIIKEFYRIDHNPDWHSDLGSLLQPGSSWFAPTAGGKFRLVRDENGAIVAAGGLYDLRRKPETLARVADRYAASKEICQIVRVYLASSIRRQGLGRRIVELLENDARELTYDVAYLHADATTEGTLKFWAANGYREFSRFSYPSPKGIEASVDFGKRLSPQP